MNGIYTVQEKKKPKTIVPKNFVEKKEIPS